MNCEPLKLSAIIKNTPGRFKVPYKDEKGREVGYAVVETDDDGLTRSTVTITDPEHADRMRWLIQGGHVAAVSMGFTVGAVQSRAVPSSIDLLKE